MPGIDVDWDGLTGDLKDEVVAGLKGLVDGAKEDLQEFGSAIAKDLVRAVREKREDLLEELGDQIEGLAELNRIRAVNATWAQVKNFVAIVGRVAMKAIAKVAV